MQTTHSLQRNLALIITFILLVLAAAQFVYTIRTQVMLRSEMAWLANFSVGMTMNECVAVNGPPNSRFPSAGPIVLTNYSIHETLPASDSAIFYERYPMGVLLYFDGSMRCTRVRVLYT